jgi:hypothetical protein
MSKINLNTKKLPNFFEQKKLIISEFDFDKIQKTMNFLGLKYTVAENKESVPTKEQLIAVADYCIEMANKSDDGYFSIGGFEAEILNGIIELRFVLERVNLLKNIHGEGKLILHNEVRKQS